MLANPISPERSTLRRSILVSLLDAARTNLRTADRVALFEVGNVFWPRDDQPLPDEPRRVGIVLAGPSAQVDWRKEGAKDGPDGGKSFDFYHVKGVVESLLAHLGVTASYSPSTEHASLHPGRAAAVYGAASREVAAGGADDMAGDESGGNGGRRLFGYVGELHPIVREQWELGDQPVAVADLDLDAIAAAIPAMRTFTPFSTFPPARRDLALEVSEDTPAADVLAAIIDSGGALLVDARLFDVYRGAPIQTGHKSLAFSLTFQAPDKTLAGESVDKLREHIGRQVAKRLGAVVR